MRLLEDAARPHAFRFDSPVGPLLIEHDGAAVRAIRYVASAGADAHAPVTVTPPVSVSVPVPVSVAVPVPVPVPVPVSAPLPDAPTTAFAHRIAAELTEYFGGARTMFTVPLAVEGTAFQRAVWDALLEIPFGQTRTYAELAERVGSPRGIRAVGQANRRNPIPILIPCHRVVAADGGLGGYLGVDGASTALDTKRWLLRHEGALALLDL